MKCYYNDFEPYAAQWLRNLISEGNLPAGYVDERSILEVKADDLKAYTQVHLFAGIGGWPYALRLAGWPENREVWTGSCPCQPFSSAGKAGGVGDERHLWPAFYRLIAERHPAVVFGEQVASKDGRYWLAGVRDDLERIGYAIGATDLCAAGVGAPHIRQRLFWVAYASSYRAERPPSTESGCIGEKNGISRSDGDARGKAAAADSDGRSGIGGAKEGIGPRQFGRRGSSSNGEDGGMGDSGDARLQGNEPEQLQESWRRKQGGATSKSSSSPWADSILVPCADGKARRVESGLECLVDGVPFRLADGRTVEGASRSGLLRGFGNAIVPHLAAEFVRGFMESVPRRLRTSVLEEERRV